MLFIPAKIKDSFTKKENQKEINNVIKSFNQLKENVIHGQGLLKTGSWTHDLVTDEIFLTEEVYRILGCSSKEFDCRLENYYSFVYPDDLEKVKRAKEGALSGIEYDIEYRIVTTDGLVKFVHERTKALYDEKGNPTKMVGIIQDITESLDNVTRNKMLESELKKSYRIINQAQALVNMGSWEMDLIEKRIFFSDEAYRIYGVAPEQYDNTYEGFLKIVHPDDVKIIDNMQNNPSNKPVELEFRIIRQDGSVRNIYELAEFVFDEKGNPIYIYGTIQDITEEKELQKELERKQETIGKIQRRYDALIKESSVVYEILDPDGTLVYISEASERVIGYKPEERLGRKVYEFYDEAERQKLAEMIEFVLAAPEQICQRDIILKGKDGRSYYLDVQMQNFLHDPAIEGIAVNFRDVTKRVEMEKAITHLSTHDDLTGLPNNRYLRKELEILCQHAKKANASFAVFMLDIDSYKNISDTLGYKFGEQLIIQIAIRLKAYCGYRKFLSRYSGDRFVIIVDKGKEDTTEEYDTTAKEIIELFSRTVKVDKYFLDVNVNMGISIYRKGVRNDEMLIRQAETALFLAKKEGRNKYRFYSSEINIHEYKLFELRNDLRRALEDNQFRVCYQPIVNLKTNEILAAEALIRWEHPDWGIVSPVDFISQAEETGFINNIGDWLIKEVCRNYRQWLDEGLPEIKVSINYSSIQFFENNFVEKILAVINEFELDPHFLIMEITESVLMVEADKAVSVIRRLQSHGIQVALDDFGTGFSSLAYLSSFNINILKVDGSFIKSAILDDTSNIVTKSIINMAKELQIKLVAEGIEKWEQLSYLLNLDCRAGQGYLYSKPLSYEEFALVLSKGKCEPLIIDEGRIVTNEDRRKFFRIKFPQLLEANLTMKEFRGKRVNVGNTKVLLKNIGPGGLCFISNIRIPTEPSVVLQFTTKLKGKELRLYGSPVWSDETVDNLYEYGLEFRINENERMQLVKLLNGVK